MPSKRAELLRRLIGELKQSQGHTIIAPAPRPIAKPNEIDVEKIVSILPKDDRGEKLDVQLARVDGGYYGRNRELVLGFLARVDGEKRRLAAEKAGEELREEIVQATRRQEVRAAAEKSKAAEATARAAAAEEERWQKR